MHAIDAVIVLAFVAYAVSSGLRSRRKASESLSEYFLAGRSLPGWQAGLSMAATQFAADTPLLVMGLLAVDGVFGLFRLWVYGIAFLLLGYVLAPSWRRAGVLTDAELSEARYGGRAALVLRGVKALYFGLIFNCAVLAMVLMAATRIAEPFLTWHAWLPHEVMAPIVDMVRAVGVSLAGPNDPAPWLRTADNLISIVAIVAVTGFYSAAGGLRSVVRTDMAQLALALIGTALYAYYALDAAGGLDAVRARLPEALASHPEGMTARALVSFSPAEAPNVSAALLALLGLQWLIQMNADGTGYLAQRCMACRTDDDARRATVVFAWTQIVLRSLLWLPIGLALLVLMPPDGTLAGPAFVADRELTYVRGMVELLPPGPRGVLFTAMLAALASTLDSHINWGASYFTNDFYGRLYCGLLKRREPTARELVRVARLSSAGIVLVALAVMTQLSSIQRAWKVTLLLGAGMGIMLLLRWLWWRITAAGELASIVTSSLLAPVLVTAIPDSSEAVRLLAIAAASTTAGVLVSLLTAPSDRRPLEAFFTRVRPPGLWGPIARDPGEASAARARLWSGLARTALASLALFAALIGLGSWLVGSSPRWLPSVSAWSLLMLACSALATLALARSSRPRS